MVKTKLKEILEGWANVVKLHFNSVDPFIQTISEIRLKICDKCDMRVNNVCDRKKVGTNIVTGEEKRGCGCNIAAKTLSPSSKCPLSKW